MALQVCGYQNQDSQGGSTNTVVLEWVIIVETLIEAELAGKIYVSLVKMLYTLIFDRWNWKP